MSVTPCSINLFQDKEYLTQLLLAGQQKSRETGHQHFVSISQKISAIDPLLALELLTTPEQHYFYLENPVQRQAIAGIGAVSVGNINLVNRFQKSQEFISQCQSRTTSVGDLHLQGAGTHFFCGFSFFSDVENSSSPFTSTTIFLPKWQIHRQPEYCLLVANLGITYQSNISYLVDSLVKGANKIIYLCHSTYLGSIQSLSLEESNQRESNQKIDSYTQEFKSAVISALNSINQGKFQKIVLAQIRELVAKYPLSMVSSLHNLRSQYPDCYTFAISNGRGYTFLGASPERLISIKQQKLVTDALAGSAPRHSNSSLDHKIGEALLNNSKERNEHQTVVDFIDRSLRELNLQPQRATFPQLLKLSNIQHLWTPIFAPLDHNLHPLEIIAKLHPTPAVAGTPQEIVSAEIRKYEQFDRGLYAAPIGWIDSRGNSEFIVAIRSCLIHGCHATLYAGAGIITGSDPDQELAEITLKFQPLLQALAVSENDFIP